MKDSHCCPVVIQRKARVVVFCISIVCSVVSNAEAGRSVALPDDVNDVIRQYCVACHGAKKSKGDVRLDSLTSLDQDARQDTLNRMQEAIHFEEMPPEEEKQPTRADRKLLESWLARTLEPLGPSKLSGRKDCTFQMTLQSEGSLMISVLI